MSGKLLFFGSILTLFIAGLYFDQVELEDKRKQIKKFDGYSVDGIIKDLYYNHSIIDMYLEDDTTHYVFRVDNQYPNDIEYTFEVTAQAGDRIVKLPYSDTIQLIKKNKIFRYSHWVPSNRED